MKFVCALTVLLLAALSACQAQVDPSTQPIAVDPALRQQERATLPVVTAVQKWQQIATISLPENNAPSIIPLSNGDYRVYWNALSLNGIGSATTLDGIHFNTDDGARLINNPAGQPDCAIGKPWAIQVVNGYRMYYQGQPENCDGEVTGITANSRIFSAFSSDGRSFERDAGIRVDVGEASGLAAAGHGRVIQTDDGMFRMYFTALLPNQLTPPVIMTAISLDTLNWSVGPSPIMQGGYDPTALQIEDTISMYVSYMTDSILLLESHDGLNFTPTAWVEFYDAQNNPIAHMSDIDIIDLTDGSLVIYGSGSGTNGIGAFKAMPQ